MKGAIGFPPLCGTCKVNYVSTSRKYGYLLRCDDCLSVHADAHDGYHRSVECPSCGAPVEAVCVDRLGREMSYVHKARRQKLDNEWKELFES
jgi:hypothetical protein